jgi:hypothetical protein
MSIGKSRTRIRTGKSFQPARSDWLIAQVSVATLCGNGVEPVPTKTSPMQPTSGKGYFDAVRRIKDDLKQPGVGAHSTNGQRLLTFSN